MPKRREEARARAQQDLDQALPKGDIMAIASLVQHITEIGAGLGITLSLEMIEELMTKLVSKHRFEHLR